jgi:hypothetical protein
LVLFVLMSSERIQRRLCDAKADIARALLRFWLT